MFRPVVYLSLISYLFLLCVVWLLPVSFTACSRGDWLCTAAYWLTESGGKTCTVLILIITCFFYTVRIETVKEKLKAFMKSFLGLALFLGVFAFVNEHVTKESLRIPRPSHLFIVSQSRPLIKIDTVYSFEVSDRKIFLENMIRSDSTRFKNIDPRVLKHWVDEAGYSFPSGHSFNAFLLTSVLTFSMYHSRSSIARYLYLMPFPWALAVAISRVALGAHSALDVSFGAGMGILLAFLFLYSDQTRSLVSAKKFFRLS